MQDPWVTPAAAVLVEPSTGWAESLFQPLTPGAYAFVISNELAGIEGRRAGFELRDTMLILTEGPCTRFALLFRKPPEAYTMLGQVAETAAGVLNIGACRVSYVSENDKTQTVGKGKPGLNPGCGPDLPSRKENWGAWEVNNAGRWPPNVLIVHGQECRKLGARRVRGNPTSKTFHEAYEGESITGFLRGWSHSGNQHSDSEGMEVVTSYECHVRCPALLLDRQTGERPSTLTGRADPTKIHTNPGNNHGASLFGGGNSNVYADSGGASRYYPQFATDDELVEWLKKLLSPPKGV